MEDKNRSFTQGPILPTLIRFALPVLAALFLQTLYGAVDLLVVGQFSAAAEVSGVATGSQLMNTATVVINGLSMGLTILVGQFIGRAEARQAGRIVGTGITLFAVIGLILTVVFVGGAEWLAGLLQAPPEAMEATVAYIRICSGGLLFIVAYNLLGGIMRATGDANLPLISVAIACAVNIAGDLLLVGGLQMGAAGAAVATAAAQGISVILCLLLLKRRKSLPFVMKKVDLRPSRRLVSEILRLGIPVAAQDLLVHFSFLVLTAIVNAMGVIASAGVGVAERLCGFIMLAPSAFMQSMSAFVAQNEGAGKPERSRRALVCGIAVSLGVGAVLGTAAFFFGDAMASIFAKDPEIIAAAADYLKAYAIDTFLTSFLFCFIGYFNGCGRTLFVMVQGILGAFAVRIPVAFFVSRMAGVSLFLLGLATPASSFVQILLCMAAFVRYRKRDAAGSIG